LRYETQQNRCWVARCYSLMLGFAPLNPAYCCYIYIYCEARPHRICKLDVYKLKPHRVCKLEAGSNSQFCLPLIKGEQGSCPYRKGASNMNDIQRSSPDFPRVFF